MKTAVKFAYIITSTIFVLYLCLPNHRFPDQLPGARQSFEPADVETLLRRGYYTDLTRDQVMDHYVKQLEKSSFFGLRLPTYRLNYPPEEAQTLIRDQARSTFLEEIVHPFRESFFINGYEPKEDKDLILIDGKYWRQKVIVRHVPSKTMPRIVIGVFTVLFIPLISKSWINFVGKQLEDRKKR